MNRLHIEDAGHPIPIAMPFLGPSFLAAVIRTITVLWRFPAAPHNQFFLTVTGHVLGDGTGYLESKTDLGHSCHQILVNYQMRDMGGEAYLRLLEFAPDGRTVNVRSYSPLYDRFLDDPDQQFSFQLDI